MPEQRKKQAFMIPRLEAQLHVAQRHSDFDPRLVEIVSKQPPNLVFAQATPESRKLYNQYSQVNSELMKLTCYLRLRINPHGILYASHTPLHAIEESLVSHFTYRFPKFVVVLGSKRGTFIGKNRSIARSQRPLPEVLAALEKQFPLDPILQDLQSMDDDVWEAFYKSQYVKEKDNPTLFRRQVPKQILKMDGFEEERKLSRKGSLEKFLAPK